MDYALALIDIGKEEDCLEQISTDMEAFASLPDQPAYSEMEPEARRQAVRAACQELRMSTITASFLEFVVARKSVVDLPLVQQEFMLAGDSPDTAAVCGVGCQCYKPQPPSNAARPGRRFCSQGGRNCTLTGSGCAQCCCVSGPGVPGTGGHGSPKCSGRGLVVPLAACNLSALPLLCQALQ